MTTGEVAEDLVSRIGVRRSVARLLCLEYRVYTGPNPLSRLMGEESG